MLFYVLAAGLVVFVLILLLPPLWRSAQSGNDAAKRQQDNLTVLRSQLAELEQERCDGVLTEDGFAQAKQELQRRVLDELSLEEHPGAQKDNRHQRWPALVILILLPLLSATGYWIFGTAKALDPLAMTQAPDITPGQIEAMVGKLAARLAENPEDTDGWIMLAKSYKSLGRAKDAVDAYAKVEATLVADPDLLIDYADALAMQAGGDLAGKPMTLINKALHLDPDHLLALWLAGTAAFNQQNFPAAIIFWQRALSVLPPGSADSQTLNDGITEAKQRIGRKTDSSHAVAGRVDLAPALRAQVEPGDSLFVFARAVEGSRFPLAVVKVKVSDLPYSFVLDDSLSMMADQRISTHARVIVEARISRSGNAVAKDGDLESKAVTVKLGERRLGLVIDHVVQR